MDKQYFSTYLNSNPQLSINEENISNKIIKDSRNNSE